MTRPLRFWCVLAAITMSLGWGMRGSIGGGSLGAMIPGAMIGLVLCLLLQREADAGLIAAFAAIGVGFGGQETYGQTVGLSLHPETFWWAILGFAIKGAVWGLLGGAFIGIAFDRRRFAARNILLGFAIMIVGTWIGWKLVNDPKLIYFSNRIDRPRQELWAGLWLGGLMLLAWMRARVPWLFALYGAVGGGIGFAFGASLQPWGKGMWAEMPLGWWKGMELTFGALLGLSYALCAWRLRFELSGDGKSSARPASLPRALALAGVAIGLAIVAGETLPGRFGYTIAGAVLAGLVLFSDELAWHTAITTTAAAFFWDFLKNQQIITGAPGWALVIATTVLIGFIVARNARAKTMLVLLTWAAMASEIRYLMRPSKIGPTVVTMLLVFVVFAAVVTWLTAGRERTTAAAVV